jgi:hypothetical protein
MIGGRVKQRDGLTVKTSFWIMRTIDIYARLEHDGNVSKEMQTESHTATVSGKQQCG